MPVMIRGLPDSAGLLFFRISGLNNTFDAAEEFYDVIDSRPAETALTVESEANLPAFRVPNAGAIFCWCLCRLTKR